MSKKIHELKISRYGLSEGRDQIHRSLDQPPIVSVLIRILGRNHLPENELRLEVHFHANQRHFQMKGFERGLVLTKRHILTRKWPLQR